jgi:hypothetical protein
MPRAGSIRTRVVAGGTAFEFLDAGYEQLRQLAFVGTPISRMALFFGVSEDWLAKQIENDPFAEAAYKGGIGDGELELRIAGHDAAKAGDARVLTFMMERRLGMNKVVEQKHDHVHRVIGAVPAGRLTADDWMKQYGPAQLEPPKQPVIDAEATDVTDNAGADSNE